MSTSHLPHAVLSHHGIHIVSRSKKESKVFGMTAMVYRISAASAALLLMMTVC